MAYINKEGKGPYPNRAGEYCGNYYPNSKYVARNPEDEIAYLSRMRFGRPHPCMGQTSAERAKKGWVGLYLKEDSPYNLDSDVDVPTPPELMEPPMKPPEVLF